MSLDVEALENEAREQTGLDDFGDGSHREGLERLVAALNEEAELTEAGEVMLRIRVVALLTSRLRIEDAYREHPEIDDEVIEGPVFVVGLPRTGTTALSQLVAADPQFRSLRLWESSSPCPPPETATEHSDPRIAETEAGLAMMNQMFPLMQTMHHEEATTPTECQDLLGMSFRTVHFDGFGHVPSYLSWVTECDMRGTYRYHRRVLEVAAVALPAAPLAPQDPRPHVLPGRTPGDVSRCQVPLESPRPGQGAGLGVQSDPLRPELGQRS